MNRLIDIGFEKVGHWRVVGKELEFELTSLAQAENVLYAFLSQGEVKYIGKTSRSLEKRLYGYKYPDTTQSTNIKNNAANVREILLDGGSVEVWAWADPGYLRYGEFRVNLAAGLEDNLISKIKPPWNGREGNSRWSLPNVPEPSDTPIDPEGLPAKYGMVEQRREFIDTRGQFTFLLRPTYYNQGFFNVGVDFERLFAGDGAPGYPSR